MSRMSELDVEKQDSQVEELGYRIMVEIGTYFGRGTPITHRNIMIVRDALASITAYFESEHEKLTEKKTTQTN